MHPLLQENLTSHIDLTEEELERIDGLFQQKTLKKKHYLLQEGETSQGLAFVVSGLLRSYKVDSGGFEHVIQFAPAGWWMTDMKSFSRQTPAELFIEALEPAEYLFITKSKLDFAFKAFPKLEKHFRLLAENAVIAYQQRLIGNLSQPAIERFANFCQLYPTLTQTLPHKQIAAFIGVTPEFFSKMINNTPLPG